MKLKVCNRFVVQWVCYRLVTASGVRLEKTMGLNSVGGT